MRPFMNSHVKLLENFALLAGFLFIGWALVSSWMEPPSHEIWPVRIAISLAFTGLGLTSKIFRFSGLWLEWGMSLLAVTASAYAFYIGLTTGFTITWACGTVLILMGSFNFFNFPGPLLFYLASTTALSCSGFYFRGSIISESMQWTVALNCLTGLVLGLYSSIQRTQFLFQVVRSSARQEQILASMAEGQVLFDQNGELIYHNSAVNQILAVSYTHLTLPTIYSV